MKSIILNSKSEIKQKLNSSIAFSSQNYKLILKNKEFSLEIYNHNEEFNNSFIKIGNNKHLIAEVQKHGGWTGALQGLVRELWLREIELKSEAEILFDKNKTFSKFPYNIWINNKYMYMGDELSKIITYCREGYHKRERYTDEYGKETIGLTCQKCMVIYNNKEQELQNLKTKTESQLSWK